MQFVRQRVRLKESDPVDPAHAFDPAMSAWQPHGYQRTKVVGATALPTDERQAVDRHLSQIDQIEQSQKIVDADLAQHGSARSANPTMTLPGVDMTALPTSRQLLEISSAHATNSIV
jgi:transposase